MTTAENHLLLGLDPGASHEQIRDARRSLSLLHHPDRGGDPETMARINRAADELLAGSTEPARVPTNGSPTTATAPSTERAVVVDRPSFTIDVLPVEAHEVLSLAVASIGDLMDEDPPYVLEFTVFDVARNGDRVWCRADIVPDAGSSTVSLSAEARYFDELEQLRDRLVGEINTLGFER